MRRVKCLKQYLNFLFLNTEQARKCPLADAVTQNSHKIDTTAANTLCQNLKTTKNVYIIIIHCMPHIYIQGINVSI